jgi:hypothetical protein
MTFVFLSMFTPRDTFEIDVLGDVLLVVLQGDTDASGAEIEDDIAGSETLLDDAESVDTLTSKSKKIRFESAFLDDSISSRRTLSFYRKVTRLVRNY